MLGHAAALGAMSEQPTMRGSDVVTKDSPMEAGLSEHDAEDRCHGRAEGMPCEDQAVVGEFLEEHA